MMENVSEVWEIGDSGNKRSMRNRGWRKRTTFGDSMMEDGYFRTQMTLLANISPLEQGFGLQRSYSVEKASFGVFFRPIATMRSVRIPKVGYDASKGHLSPLATSGCANVIEERVVFGG
ncbi:hypothetical protein NYE44_19635 [Paenibacillus sp. FSL L8-0493]|uniref:hypothetical protein n=1 Tax=unclassified Paenibacillus TaxID=185978 RepID=UPI0030D4D0D0